MDDEIKFPKVSNACAILRQLEQGKILRIDGYPYPIAMGEDYSVGFLYANDKVVGDFTVQQFIELAGKVGPVIPDIPRFRSRNPNENF